MHARISSGLKAGVLIALVGLIQSLWAGQTQAGEITIAAASDLNFAFKEIVADFETKTGNTVKLSLGSSGNFFAQLSNGAPFDVFFSADIGYPKKLEEAGLAEPGTLYMYAIGRIVVWVPKGSPIDVASSGMKALQHPSVKKVAIANPRHAPYGRAAVAAMEHFKVYDAVKDKLVLGENISQTAQFVQTGAADIGIIALSLAVAQAMKETGTYWEVPLDAYPKLEQGAVVLKAAKDLKTARAFLDYIKSPEGTAVFKRYGFVLPEKASPVPTLGQEPHQHQADPAECSKLPQDLKAVVEAMDKPGRTLGALATRAEMSPLAPAVQRLDVVLHQADRVSLIATPKTEKVEGQTFAGLLTFSVPQDGNYRVSSDTAFWIDVLDGDKALERAKLNRRMQCGRVHKSIGFALKAGVIYWLQLSSSKTRGVQVMITSE